MRSIVLTTALLVVGSSAFAQSASPDTAGARVPVEHYLQGHATGDGAHFKAAFAPQAYLFWVRADTLATRTSDDYIKGAGGKPAADEAQRKRWIESIDVSGNTGVAKVVLDYPTTRFVDYLSLLKINGEWKIINKIFYAEPKK
jgi:regulator of protease activity HflC (stomatin/prohibitin superfamily)